VRAVLLVLVLVLTGCSAEVTGTPAQRTEDASVVGPVDLTVPIEMRPVVETGSAEPATTELPDPSGEVLPLSDPVMTVERLDRAEAQLDQNQQWVLTLTLTSDDAAAFADWTANHVGERLAMVIDGEVVIAPEIQAAITGGVVQIAGDYTRDEIHDLLAKITGR
jgi:preprotein translocase subunit SecD